VLIYSEGVDIEKKVQTILKRTIFVLIFLIIIFFVLYAFDLDFSFNHKKNIFFLSLILLIILCLIFFFTKAIKKHMVIDQNEIKITDKIFKIKLKSRNYPCNMINKFIIGIIENKYNKYTVYIDQNNEISEIMTFAAYKEWMKIFAQIKEKTDIKIYDGTDKSYRTEDDLFREYFRLKNMLNEIKQDGK